MPFTSQLDGKDMSTDWAWGNDDQQAETHGPPATSPQIQVLTMQDLMSMHKELINVMGTRRPAPKAKAKAKA